MSVQASTSLTCAQEKIKKFLAPISRIQFLPSKDSRTERPLQANSRVELALLAILNFVPQITLFVVNVKLTSRLRNEFFQKVQWLQSTSTYSLTKKLLTAILASTLAKCRR